MKINLQPSGTEAHDYSMSMTDLSFLLIIFFLLAAVFIAAQGIPILLPEEGVPPVPADPETVIFLHLDTHGNVRVEGELIALTAPAWKQALLAAYTNKPGTTALLEVEEAVAYQDVVKVLDSARDIGLYRVSIVVREARPVPLELPDEEESA